MRVDLRTRCMRSAAAAALCALLGNAPAGAAIPVFVNGQAVKFDQPPVEKAARVFVPLRGVFERLGADVAFTPPGSVVATQRGAQLVKLTVGNKRAVINGKTRMMDAPAFMRRGRVLVPLRLLSEAAGAKVAYSRSPKAVRITSAMGTARRPATAPAAKTTGKTPWWLWLIVLLLILALLLWLLSRRKRVEPIITSRTR